MLRRLVALLIGLLAGVSAAGTTTASAVTTYGGPAFARVEFSEFEAGSVAPARLIKARVGFASPAGEGRSTSTTSPRSVIATEAGTDLVKYDPEWASRQLLDQNLPGSSGYGVTPGGRTVSAHAADVIANGGRGRPPTSLSTVDGILDTGTSVRWDPTKGTVRVTQPGIPGRPFVAVDDATGNHIVTAMVPK